MATFDNNLRLKEITPGDEDGTWGGSTNTNLELIADGFGTGTIQFAADADETFTIADGSADEVRAFVLDVTSAGSLTTTRVATLAPNTVNKVWIVKNSTTGGQSIQISQGSGANVTIAPGETKAIYGDGAGSGAAITDFLAGLVIGGAFGVEGAVTLESTLDVNGNLSASGTITQTSTDAGATIGPILTLHRDSASPADDDVIGGINFDGEDDGGNQTTYARINAEIKDVTGGTEDGDIVLSTVRSGTLTEAARLSSDGKWFLGDVLGSSPSGELIMYRSGGNRPLIRLLDSTNDSFIEGGQTLRFGTFSSLGTTVDMELDADGGLRIDSAPNQIGEPGFYSGTGDALVRSQLNSSVANGATTSMVVGRRFCGIVVVSVVDTTNASIRTCQVYSAYFYEGDNTTIVALGTGGNGTGGARTFTPGYDDPTGSFTVTNTSGSTCAITISAYGGKAL